MVTQVGEMLAGAVGCEAQFGIAPLYGSANPLAFKDLQDVQELSSFFERRFSAYQVGVMAASPSTTTSDQPRHLQDVTGFCGARLLCCGDSQEVMFTSVAFSSAWTQSAASPTRTMSRPSLKKMPAGPEPVG